MAAIRRGAPRVPVASGTRMARTASTTLPVSISRSARLPSSFNEAMTSPQGTSITLAVIRSWLHSHIILELKRLLNGNALLDGEL